MTREERIDLIRNELLRQCFSDDYPKKFKTLKEYKKEIISFMDDKEKLECQKFSDDCTIEIKRFGNGLTSHCEHALDLWEEWLNDFHDKKLPSRIPGQRRTNI